MMHIVATQYSLSTQSLDIYFSGCNPPHCKGCHNSELHEFGTINNYKQKLPGIVEKIKDFDLIIKNIFILGGEPLDQDLDNLYDFIREISSCNKAIWLFTKYPLSRVPSTIKELCSYIKSGRFEIEAVSEDNIQYGIKIASKNQKVFKRGNDY